MKYKFEIPKAIKINDQRRRMTIHGGMCPSENVIYLYGCNNGRREDEAAAFFYSVILNHEHLHAILHEVKIPVKFHEIIIHKMGW